MRKNLNACLHPCDAAPVSAVIPAACEIQRYQIFCYTWIESCAVYDLTDLILHSIFMYEKLARYRIYRAVILVVYIDEMDDVVYLVVIAVSEYHVGETFFVIDIDRSYDDIEEKIIVQVYARRTVSLKAHRSSGLTERFHCGFAVGVARAYDAQIRFLRELAVEARLQVVSEFCS